MRQKDWSTTLLGPVEQWPQSLRTSVSICLNSRFPIIIWWGPDLVILYNDAYRDMTLQGKHPQALGQPGRVVWNEIWPVIGPMLEGVLKTGIATWSDDLLLFLERHGYPEETYHTFSYSPIRDESGGIGGVFTPVTETTASVLSTRRMRTLKDLAARGVESKRAQDAIDSIRQTLRENRYDVPFSMLYLLSEDGRTATFEGATGMQQAQNLQAGPFELGDVDAEIWPLSAVLESGQPVVVEDLSRVHSHLLPGPWKTAADSAIVMPIRQSNLEKLAGFLVLGVNPHRRLDADYRSFFDLLAGNVATALAGAFAYEEEIRRNAALAELDRAKTAFFNNVSHEFRTPLTLMLGPLEDTLADGALPAPSVAALTMVHRNAMRLLRLVNTLLDFSRLEAGRLEASYAPTDLSRLTDELASVFRSTMERAGLRYVVECDPLGEPFYVDEDMWEKIVFNLLSNAIKFTPHGEVRVRLRRLGERAQLTVSDTGIGVPEAEVPRLFERFHRIRNVGARTHEGTGIGLALVRELVSLHGGEVGAISELGQGTTFTVEIPRGHAHLPADRVGATRTQVSTVSGVRAYLEEADNWLGQDDTMPLESELDTAERDLSKTVLVVDDNADMRDYVSRLLARYWNVRTASNGEQALEMLARDPLPDLILSDIMMPRLDGFGLLARVRQDPRTQELPVILLSARAGEESKVEGLEAGADDYLTKPFAARELLARVSSHLKLNFIRRKAQQLEQANARLRELDRLKSEFLASMSHELRTPLNAIIGFSDLLRKMPPDELAGPQSPIFVEQIFRAGVLLLQLVNDVLDLARIESGHLQMQPRWFQLSKVVGDVAEMVRARAEQKHIDLHFPDVDLRVWGDPSRLTQILLNLITNAVKFTPAGGRASVAVEQTDGQVKLLVTDTGIGIEQNDQERIFHAFEQVVPSSGNESGSGLGLAICRRLVEAHGGTITVRSAPGSGSTFEIVLPQPAGEGPAEAPRDPGH
jgi:signal transduction histidine kinase